MDCARVLLRPVEDLAKTDICSHAMEQLKWAREGEGVRLSGCDARRNTACCTVTWLVGAACLATRWWHALGHRFLLSQLSC